MVDRGEGLIWTQGCVMTIGDALKPISDAILIRITN